MIRSRLFLAAALALAAAPLAGCMSTAATVVPAVIATNATIKTVSTELHNQCVGLEAVVAVADSFVSGPRLQAAVDAANVAVATYCRNPEPPTNVIGAIRAVREIVAAVREARAKPS